jgi:hypothetical protein
MGAPLVQFVTVTLTSQTPSSPLLSSTGRVVCSAAKPNAKVVQILKILVLISISF